MSDVLEINVETGEQTIRDYSAAEKKEFIKYKENADAIQDAAEAEAAVKETQRQVILDRLGLTSDEARLLLGS
jgi:hypothetical protein